MKSILNSPRTKRHWLFILLPVLLLLLSSSPPSWAGSSEYEHLFNQYGSRFLAHIPNNARWLSAQTWQESGYNPTAVSRVGAMGLMQTMPRTHEEIGRQLGVRCSAFNPRCSIMYGAFYDSKMYSQWDRRGRQTEQVIPFMLASYNAGLGTVLKAQARCNDGRLFADINHCLPRETSEYVPRIRAKYIELGVLL